MLAWQLDLQFRVKCPGGGSKTVRTPYHRVVGLKLCPCTSDELGAEVEPFQVRLGQLTGGRSEKTWEVHHGDDNTRNNAVANLFTLFKVLHTRLKRPRSP